MQRWLQSEFTHEASVTTLAVPFAGPVTISRPLVAQASAVSEVSLARTLIATGPLPRQSASVSLTASGGVEMQYVEVELDPGEAAIGEAGVMMYMQDGIAMDTVFGDGSAQQSGLFGKLLGAGKRLLTGESLFTTLFHNEGTGKRRVAFAAPYPGKIVAVDLSTVGGTLICQKDAFLAAAKGVALGIAFQRKIGVGLFGGAAELLDRRNPAS